MSTLRCTNLQDTSGGNSLTTAQIYNGAAKAWVNFNGTGTVAIRASFNVSSITDSGTGAYRVNLTTAFSDTNYTTLITSYFDNTYGAAYLTMEDVRSGGVRTTSAFPIGTHNNTNLNDSLYVMASAYR